MTYIDAMTTAWDRTMLEHEQADENLAATQAFAVVEAFEAYQPYNFKPGGCLSGIKKAWFDADKSLCRSLALASISEIEVAIDRYQTTN